MKSGSCFADLAGIRACALNKVHYDEEYFDIDKAIVVPVEPVLFDNDNVNDGAAMESEANNLEMMVNIRRNEAGHGGEQTMVNGSRIPAQRVRTLSRFCTALLA